MSLLMTKNEGRELVQETQRQFSKGKNHHQGNDRKFSDGKPRPGSSPLTPMQKGLGGVAPAARSRPDAPSHSRPPPRRPDAAWLTGTPRRHQPLCSSRKLSPRRGVAAFGLHRPRWVPTDAHPGSLGSVVVKFPAWG